ncbi:potassium-transporting ATPase subunit KdpB [Escherichia coli]|nr:K(+)-transporting ATPase subunit B [Salmonella enterica]ECS2971931.1 K(+)-transporting ATPase subunit B [Salmonella enterica subsp. enterica serovar Bredeney]EFB2764560.1 potassium-transporting ATPase subunit KdpB [Escherichia coli]EGF6384847.1 potassium-transporting ATPase subunit KdpB [Salmonella enterica subsp. enterica serovar Cubana]MLA27524.1 K(+)-transporting ATPase subunit B [Salmonella enterica subsp. enterica serovar Worthington]VGG06662.1 potassium-transporting ATPase subunit B [
MSVKSNSTVSNSRVADEKNTAAMRPSILAETFAKLSPASQAKNPVMFVVYLGSIITTLLGIQALIEPGQLSAGFIFALAVWLWFTVLFANAAEAMAEGRGKAQAQALRATRKQVNAKVLKEPTPHSQSWSVPSNELSVGQFVMVEAGEVIPADGEVVAGAASVDESAITGESAPVIRESGGDFCSVTGGTTVLSDWIVARVTAKPGEAFLDRMIAMVEGAKRGKTPNEIALMILLVALTLIFLLVCVTLLPFSGLSVILAGAGDPVSIAVLIALLVCLIPTTIGALLSAVGIAGMSRMMKENVLTTSGRAIEAAGDVDVLLLDKTGTITVGNREAVKFLPVGGISEAKLAQAAMLSSLADETPEGRSIVQLAKMNFSLTDTLEHNHEIIPFSAHTRMSGVNLSTREIRKGAASAIQCYIEQFGSVFSNELQIIVDDVSRRGSTPLVVAENATILGVVELKDIIKHGIKKNFREMRALGIKTVMVTGDNMLTAAAIAAEAGVDDYLAEATPEDKLKLIRKYQNEGRLVAMTGDGTNDAPALAQADVAVAMNSGTQAAKEAGNMVDLDSNPTKLLKVVQVGKQMIMTRGALTTFSVANDLAKYFAIIPAAFVATYPPLASLNIMHLHSPASAILSAVIFNALIIVVLIPLALRGIKYRAESADRLLSRHLLIYGLGGVVAPFIGIKVIDIILSLFM